MNLVGFKMQHLATVPIWACLPFALFLLCMALIPLINRRWWEDYYSFISLPLGIFVALFYYWYFDGAARIAHTGLDYFSFITLLGSLFVVSGGILIRIEGRAHPLINSMILLIGALISNVVGTTGASMLLIRPYLHMNRERLNGYLVVFFIFVVSNVGGALTPIGDPPLFLGYLKGVPFFWVLSNAWVEWLFALLIIIVIFFVIDWRHHKGIKRIEEAVSKSRIVFKGWYNFIFLALILFAVFKTTPVREIIMIAAGLASYFLTPRAIHREHHFQFEPIKEVAILFFGIFCMMIPALDWLEINAPGLGLESPGAFYWASGSLSAVLDNAPTYLSFLSTAMGLKALDVAGLVEQAPAFVKAISLAAVFFGAMTYIGNGPNFMVRAIADKRGANCPTFIGYVLKFSIPVLLPVFFLVWFIFLR